MRTTPNTYKDPIVSTLADPVGIDKIIQTLQVAYQSLSWLEKSFGRAFVMTRKTDDERFTDLLSRQDEVFPAIWQGDGIDMLNLMPNDNLNAYSFFVAQDAEEPIDGIYRQYERNSWYREIDNIWWLNLKRIDPDKTYFYAEELKEAIKTIITNTRFEAFGGVTILNIYERPQQIFEGFTLDLAKTQALTYPYHGFRFRMRAFYQDDCA